MHKFNRHEYVLTLPDMVKALFQKISYLDFDSILVNGKVPSSAGKEFSQYIPEEISKEIKFQILNRLTDPERGFVVVRNFVPKNSTVKEKIFYASIICSFIGRQFKVIESTKLWNPLGVNLEKKSHESEGVGYNCVHIDVPNTTKIPEITCLFCDTPDFNKGGKTIVSNILKLLSLLSPDDIDICKSKVFYEGKHFGLINVGEEYMPFPIIESEYGKLYFRFSGIMIEVLHIYRKLII